MGKGQANNLGSKFQKPTKISSLQEKSRQLERAMEDQKKVILHGMWVSPFVKRVELALKLKNIPFDYVEEDLGNKSELLLKYNPVYRKVPVLVHNGNPICESTVILEYIDETWKHGPKLLPEDPYQRAQARFWCKFLQDQVFGAYLALLKTGGEEQQKAKKEMEEKLEVLENGMKEYLAGGKPDVNDNNVGMLDIMFCCVLGPYYKAQEEVVGMKLVDADKFPILFSWLMALLQLRVVKEVTPPHEKVVQRLRFIRNSALASTSTSSASAS